MAEKSYLNYVPPGALRDVAQTGYQLLDNIIGFDDDYDTTGELLGQSLARDPLGTTKAIGAGVVDAAKAAYADPMGTLGNIKDEFVDAFTLLSTPLPEDATREQMGQHLEAASILATAIPAYKGVQLGGRAAVGGVDNALQAQADRFYYPEGFTPPPILAPGSRMIVPSQAEYDMLPSEVLADQFELPIRDAIGERIGSRIVTPMGEDARERIRPYGDDDLRIADNYDLAGTSTFGQYLPDQTKIEMNPSISPEDYVSTRQHELAHFDQDQSRLPYQEGGTTSRRMAEVRNEHMGSLNALANDPSIPKDERKRYKDLLKEYAYLTPYEMYQHNPGEMLARLAQGDYPTTARRLSAFQMLNPYIGSADNTYLNRIKSAYNTGFKGYQYFDEVPMDLNQSRVYDDFAYDTYDPMRPEVTLDPSRASFAQGPKRKQSLPPELQAILDKIGTFGD
jgi:hypothetical protein